MDQQFIDAKVAYGYSKAASKIGSACDVFRPSSSIDPLAQTPISTTLMAAFDVTATFPFRDSIPREMAVVRGLFDPTGIKIGDIIRNTPVTVDGDPRTTVYFVIHRDPHRPAILVRTTNIVDIYDTSQPSMVSEFGLRDPSGPSTAQDVLIARGWPVSMVLASRGFDPQAKLPTDTRRPAFDVLCPLIPGIAMGAGRRLRVDTGQFLRVDGFNQNQYGWRFVCVEDEA